MVKEELNGDSVCNDEMFEDFFNEEIGHFVYCYCEREDLEETDLSPTERREIELQGYAYITS